MDPTHAAKASYHEEQRFRQWWLWAVIVISVVSLLGTFGYGFVKQLVFNQPWGDRPMPDYALAIVGSLAILSSVGLIWLFLAMTLVTEVRHDGLHIRFFPLTQTTIAFQDIRQCEARTYHPIREYGGWGIRMTIRRGKAYNVSGNCGVQLELSNGKRLLIGSQRSDELAAAINAHRSTDQTTASG